MEESLCESAFEKDFQIQRLVKTVFEKCKAEYENQNLYLPLDQPLKRAAYYTDYPILKLHQLHTSSPNPDLETNQLDDPIGVTQRKLIMQELLNFYKNCKHPTFSDLYNRVKFTITVNELSHFQNMMVKMGFDYRKSTTGYVLAEDFKQTYERFHYINKIKKYRNNHTLIYYIDERLLDGNHRFEKPDFSGLDNEECLKNGYYLYCVFSENGLVNYFFTNKKCKNSYKKWLFDIVLPLLRPNSVIIMDNHPLHGQQVNKAITLYSSKLEILNWLKNRNVPCTASMHKAELYDLVTKCKVPTAQSQYDLDEYLAAHSIEVLRLPTGFQWLSPVTRLWSLIPKQEPLVVQDMLKSDTLAFEKELISGIMSLHKYNWQDWMDHVKQIENEISFLDSLIEIALDQTYKFEVI